jgi:hypothetical protein
MYAIAATKAGPSIGPIRHPRGSSDRSCAFADAVTSSYVSSDVFRPVTARILVLRVPETSYRRDTL